VVTQTTLSVDDAAHPRGREAALPECARAQAQDICYATQNRQDAVKVLAPQVDVVIVVGSPTSSNSNRLRELAGRLGKPAYMIDDASGLDPAWFQGAQRVGLTAGASAPDVLVQQVISRLRELGAVAVRKHRRRAGNRSLPAAQGPGRQVDGRGGRVAIPGDKP
jgi:4-hydroxy-3-methylbut-2-enyl diphosphate reductase